MLVHSGLLTLFLLLFSTIAYAQYGTLKGVVEADSEPGSFARVTVLKNKEPVRGVEADEEGRFLIPNLAPGKYAVVVQYNGASKEFDNVSIESGLTSELKAVLGTTTKELETVEIQEKLVKLDASTQKVEYDAKDIISIAPNRGIAAVVSLTAGVTNAGGTQSIRGGRANQTETFIDGMRNIGNASIPQMAYGTVSVTTGAIPPWLGDLTSGAIEIFTKDPTPEHEFAVEGVTSMFLDGYEYNVVAASATGPLLKKQDSVLNAKVTKLGYVLSAEAEFLGDAGPSGIPITRVKDDVMARVNEAPLIRSAQTNSFVNATSTLRNSDFETSKVKDNNDRRSFSAFGKLQYKFNSLTNLTVGGTFRYFDGSFWSLRGSFFAPQSNAYQRTLNGRGYVRFMQTILPDSADNSVLKSFSYRVQADYGRADAVTMDENLQDNLFAYGHVGRFTYKTADVFQLISPENKQQHNPAYSSGPYWQTALVADTAVAFDPSNSSNQIYANYNRVIYDYYRQNPRLFFFPGIFPEFRGSITSVADLAILGGLPNGFTPTNPYSLFDMPGTIYNNYDKSREEIFRFTGQAEMVLGKKGHKQKNQEDKASKGTHTIKFGFEFDQRVQRRYILGPPSRLWFFMRQSVNTHILYSGDSVQYLPQYTADGFFKDTVRVVPYAYAASQTYFDRELRKALGLNPRGIDRVNIDELDPSTFSLSMFNADALQPAANPLITYYGYDYMGNVAGTQADANHFSDVNNRPQNAYRPTYLSAFIQDKFEMDNIYLAIGLRVDRLDMNQKVPKDPYIFRDYFTAADLQNNPQFNNLLEGNTLPSNIGSDWVPYVDNINQPTRVLGYRNGGLWYDANGKPVDPTVIANETNGVVQPLIKQVAGRDSLSIDAFKDSDPILNFMPRVSFSFPITDRANFFAHYDVLTQRADEAMVGLFTNYRFIQQNATNAISNPALKPMTTIDFEVGFQQSLDEAGNLAIILSAYYREMRDMIQIIRYRNAYPIEYDGFANVDFGTVKGFTFQLITRRLAKGFIKLRSAYTLQYAAGTGSSFSSSRGALNGVVGFSLLRNLLPFSYDQRHNITGNIQIFFDEKSTRGPKIGNIYPLDNTSASFTFGLGAGAPFTRSSIPNQADVQFGVNSSQRVDGLPLGSRLPFTYNVDFRLDKTFNLTLFKNKGTEGGVSEPGEALAPTKSRKERLLSFNVYLLIPNLFNFTNTIGVYQYSGQPNISGFLESPQGQQTLNDQFDKEAFTHQYRVKENNPGNFSAPRQIRLGLIVNF